MAEILFFTNLREQMGKDQLMWQETPIAVHTLKEKLQAHYHLTGLEHVMVAVNEEYAENDAVIQEGDTVALLQPVSGG